MEAHGGKAVREAVEQVTTVVTSFDNMYNIRGDKISPTTITSNKAVAEGAISFYLDQKVTARVARLTYGVSCTNIYDETNYEHRVRAHKVTLRPSGRYYVPDAFAPILTKASSLAALFGSLI